MSTITVNNMTLSIAEAQKLKDELIAKLEAAKPKDIPGTLTITCNPRHTVPNKLYGVTRIEVASGCVECFLPDGTKPYYSPGDRHASMTLHDIKITPVP